MEGRVATRRDRRGTREAPAPLVEVPHARAVDEVLAAVESDARSGLSSAEVARRLERHGPNRLPLVEPPGLPQIFLSQFASPLIYLLVVAAAVSAVLQEWEDTAFIAAVLLLNATIGTIQEYGAERGAASLRQLVEGRARVVRDGETHAVPFDDLVPGDIVLVEAGERVPADGRLVDAVGLDADESLLTGESLPVGKRVEPVEDPEAGLAERSSMLFAGTVVLHGRGRLVVTGTGREAQVGQIASRIAEALGGRPPLLRRMDRFARALTFAVAGAVSILAVLSYLRGDPLLEVFETSVALAVAVIPEGMPVAITVALAVASRRMARRNVIVRRLVAVEALGSCTYIASDKTGTLTMNELTLRAVALPGLDAPIEVTGTGLPPQGEVRLPEEVAPDHVQPLLRRLAEAGVLVNEGFVGHRDGEWTQRGDAVDIALLAFGHKLGVDRPELLRERPELAGIPFEPERAFAATLNQGSDGDEGASQPGVASVKGAVERVLPMCSRMATLEGDRPVDADVVHRAVEQLAGDGMKVIALAAGEPAMREGERFEPEGLTDLVLLGLVGMMDPLRPEAADAVRRCHDAGIDVSMVTGDHAITALAIARDLGLAEEGAQVVSGTDLRRAQAEGDEAVDRLIAPARVFARMEPEQKLDLVRSLIRQGHFIAVTGDGVNDAPALKAAHVGVAMGGAGTDVARDAAELIITDDNFASVVAGVEEGRVAYANVRKVVYLLISTGFAELLVVLLGFFSGYPLPLVAVQLLWLNLITNGIQDVALAFEPAEGDELDYPPRRPDEPIFNRLMTERVLLSALVVAGVSFGLYRWLLENGWDVDSARNLLLLQLVLFENVLVGNARSEMHFGFRISPLRNRILLVGVVAAQLVHIGAMYTPGLSDVLALEPVTVQEWATLLGLATSVFFAIELHKLVRRPHLPHHEGRDKISRQEDASR